MGVGWLAEKQINLNRSRNAKTAWPAIDYYRLLVIKHLGEQKKWKVSYFFYFKYGLMWYSVRRPSSVAPSWTPWANPGLSSPRIIRGNQWPFWCPQSAGCRGMGWGPCLALAVQWEHYKLFSLGSANVTLEKQVEESLAGLRVLGCMFVFVSKALAFQWSSDIRRSQECFYVASGACQ